MLYCFVFPFLLSLSVTMGRSLPCWQHHPVSAGTTSSITSKIIYIFPKSPHPTRSLSVKVQSRQEKCFSGEPFTAYFDKRGLQNHPSSHLRSPSCKRPGRGEDVLPAQRRPSRGQRPCAIPEHTHGPHFFFVRYRYDLSKKSYICTARPHDDSPSGGIGSCL